MTKRERVRHLAELPKAEFVAFRAALAAERDAEVIEVIEAALVGATGDWRRSWLRRRWAELAGERPLCPPMRAGQTVDITAQGRAALATVESREIGPVGLPTVEAVIEVVRGDEGNYCAVVTDRESGTLLHTTRAAGSRAWAFQQARRWVKRNQTPQRPAGKAGAP